MRVAIIGGGPAGLSAARELLAAGIDCALFDRQTALGGRWSRGEHGLCHDSLTANVSKELLAFSDFPMDAALPQFPSRAQILAYLRAYAAHHGIERVARLGYEIESLTPTSPNSRLTRWRLRARHRHDGGLIDEYFDAALVCTGAYATPRWPSPTVAQLAEQLSLRERILHAKDYRAPEPFAGERVLVVGSSASGCDIAAELSHAAASVTLAVRSPFWLLDRFDAAGRPRDHALTRLNYLLPAFLRERVARRLLGREQAALAKHGLPTPRARVDQTRVVQSTRLREAIVEGRVGVRPSLRTIETSAAGLIATFFDGSRLEVDRVLCCTGYDPDPLPWLHASARPSASAEGHMGLLRHMVSPRYPSLAFIGHVQVTGPVFPVMEMQARWIAASWSRPSAGLEAEVAKPWHRHDQAAFARTASPEPWVDSPIPRVHYLGYLDSLAADIGCRPRVLGRLLTRPVQGWRLLTGPASAAMYRLDGRGRLPGEAQRMLTRAKVDARPQPRAAARLAEG